MHRIVREILQKLKIFPQDASTSPREALTLLITNDPDHGRIEDYVRVFEGLDQMGIKVTTSVFCTMEDDGSELARHCYQDETHTLADPAYRDLMLQLHEKGHEIAFHGYSQVSNSREKFIKGLETFKETFGHYPFTYVEHGGHPNKHPLGMCKQETLALEGMKPESPYYVWDLIPEKIGCVWAWHDLLDDDYTVKQVEELFYRRDGVLFFSRARLHYLDLMIRNVAHKNGIFLGYTHFGYTGYPKKPNYRFENWTGEYLKSALKGLEQILRRYEVTNLTVQELVQKLLQNHKEED